jgi:two-component sensor histidine kinase
MQSARVVDPIAVEMLRDSQSRIRSMALIHQTLYQSNDFAKVDFSNFLDALVPTLIASYESCPGQISVSINTVETFLPISSAIPCGLLVNELVSNALKHAFPDKRRGEISIDLANVSDDMILLTVSDSGVGIPDHVDAMRTDTLGLQLVMHLVEQLKGEMAIHRANPTRFQLRFPIHRPNGAV